MVKTETINKKSGFFAFLKAGIMALIITLFLILIFAIVLKFTNISDKVIAPINLAIKAISIAVGTLILARNGEGGLKKGVLLGLIFTALAFIVFSVLNGSFVIGWSLLADFGFGALVGGIVGVIAVNLKKN